MSKVVVGMSVSLDGIAGGRNEEEFWPVHEAVLGWLFELASWRAAGVGPQGLLRPRFVPGPPLAPQARPPQPARSE